ncbi:dienelactone hydrolase family protein [Proteiniphilum sp.]|uniref:alpha/beta hydrolase family protein n=1 Tax=Proteiniphilum sp. TaxID=1926877 RepID=UPI00332008B9
MQNGLDGTVIHGAKVTLNGTEITTFSDKNGFFTLIIPRNLALKIGVKEINSNQYLVKDSYSPEIILTIRKEYFKQLRYLVSDKINDLTIGILPTSEIFNAEYYSSNHMPFTHLLEDEVEWKKIIDGVRLFHEKRLKDLIPQRERYWNRDLSSDEAYNISVESNRGNLRNILGAIDERKPVSLTKGNKVAETRKYIVTEVCWPVLKEIIPRSALQDWPELDVPGQIFGEGLLLEPKDRSKGFVVAIPDADQEPEDLVGIRKGVDYHSQFARHLVENGYTVVVPVIIDRSNRWSRGTNRSSRSWIYAQTHEMGRTVTGYEIQKMEALIDWFDQQREQDQPIGVAGYGEGGLLAFYTSALDTRVDATLVSGYFAPREEIWKEPIYRNVWGLLKEFGDAEIASLIAPRTLVVEYSQVPHYEGEKNNGTKIDPPGELWTHTFKEVESEFKRIASLTRNIGKRVLLKSGADQTLPFGSREAINTLVGLMGNESPLPLSDKIPSDLRTNFDFSARMGRMVEQMVGHTQLLLRDSEYVRKEFIESWKSKDQEQLRTFFKEEMVGWTHQDFMPVNPRTRKIEDQLGYVCYEVALDVLPDIEMWGILLIPKDIKQDEKRPAVVMQHGRGGSPYTSLNEDGTYSGIARRLADMGFVVFTPFGNWTGETRFRWIDRIAKPGKNSIWSTVGRQHQQLMRWFRTLPFIDPDRIAIYGKSIGGQASSLIASMLPEYTLAINCAYFNESARKKSSVYFSTSFVFHVDSEMPMWNRGHTLEDAEMANMLIFPRPFMVEHGKKDGIAPPGWVEHEYAKIHEHYNQQEKGELTDIDLHEGGHIINGVKSIPFLREHLDWPE